MAGNSLSAGKLGNIEPENARCRGLTLARRIYTREPNGVNVRRSTSDAVSFCIEGFNSEKDRLQPRTSLRLCRAFVQTSGHQGCRPTFRFLPIALARVSSTGVRISRDRFLERQANPAHRCVTPYDSQCAVALRPVIRV